MRYFLDTEFINEPHYFGLLSVGLACEDGREIYFINMCAQREHAGEFVRQNVLPQLYDHPRCLTFLSTPARMATNILRFVKHDRPEFWGYYCDYDWVLFTRLFGSFDQLPKHWPMYCRDLKQWCDALGNPRLPEQGKGEHHALLDARWNRQAWEFLTAYERSVNGIARG